MLNNFMRVTLTQYMDSVAIERTKTIVSQKHLPELIETRLSEVYDSDLESLKIKPTAKQVLALAYGRDGWYRQLPGNYWFHAYSIQVSPFEGWQPATQTNKETS